MATIKNLTFDEILKEVLSTDRVLIVSPDKTAFSNHEYDLKLLGKNVGYLLYMYSMSRREGDRVFETIEYAQEMSIALLKNLMLMFFWGRKHRPSRMRLERTEGYVLSSAFLKF